MRVLSFVLSVLTLAASSGALADAGAPAPVSPRFSTAYADCATMAGNIAKMERRPQDPFTWAVFGQWYENGQCVDPQLEKAALHYLRAAQSGNRVGMLRLGAMYATGRGVKDAAEARYWFRRYALEGIENVEEARDDAAGDLAETLSLPKELTDALAWVAGLLAAPPPEKYAWALRLRDGKGAEVPMHREAAYSLLRDASLQLDDASEMPEIMYELGRGLLLRDYFIGEALRSEQVGSGLTKLWIAAKAGHTDAQRLLGLYVLEHASGRAAQRTAYTWLHQAKKGGSEGLESLLQELEATMPRETLEYVHRHIDDPEFSPPPPPMDAFA